MGPVSCGDFVGISLRRHITCLLGVACDGGEAPAARAASGVKCLVGALNLFRNGEDVVLAWAAARWLGSWRLPAGRKPAGYQVIPIVEAYESCFWPAGMRKNEDLCAVLVRHTGCVRCRGFVGILVCCQVPCRAARLRGGEWCPAPGAGRVKCLAGAVHVLRLRAGCRRGAETRESGAAVDSLPGWKRSLIGRMAGVNWQRAGVRSRERTSGTWHAPQRRTHTARVTAVIISPSWGVSHVA